MQVDPFRRLLDDLASRPDSPTLNALAERDETGAVIGIGRTYTPLEIAYAAGADAALIDEAERLIAFVGEWGDPGYVHRAARMAGALRSMNRRLARFSRIEHTLGTVTVRAPRHGRGPRQLVLTIRRSTARGRCLTRTVRMGALRAHALPLAEPPPDTAAPTVSLLGTGPPTSPEVRPRQAAPGHAAIYLRRRRGRLALAA